MSNTCLNFFLLNVILEMSKIIYFIIVVFAIVNYSCKINNHIDNEIPFIDMSAETAFPKTCDTIYSGETFYFKALFTDNYTLGSFSIELHNNFNHHTHSTDIIECTLEPVKTPVNPLLFINEYQIPDGLKTHDAVIEINVPENIDTGDYHFMVRLTDATGWQALKGISIKILKR